MADLVLNARMARAMRWSLVTAFAAGTAVGAELGWNATFGTIAGCAAAYLAAAYARRWAAKHPLAPPEE